MKTKKQNPQKNKQTKKLKCNTVKASLQKTSNPRQSWQSVAADALHLPFLCGTPGSSFIFSKGDSSVQGLGSRV